MSALHHTAGSNTTTGLRGEDEATYGPTFIIVTGIYEPEETHQGSPTKRGLAADLWGKFNSSSYFLVYLNIKKLLGWSLHVASLISIISIL